MFAGGFLKFGRGGGLFLSNVPKQSTGASRVLKMEKKNRQQSVERFFKDKVTL